MPLGDVSHAQTGIVVNGERDIRMEREIEGKGKTETKIRERRENEGRWRTYISQHVVQARGLLALPACVIGASVLCLFFLKVQEDFVVGEEGCLGVFDLEVLVEDFGHLDGRYRVCGGKRKWVERMGDMN
jgi:hypothetical protein